MKWPSSLPFRVLTNRYAVSPRARSFARWHVVAKLALVRRLARFLLAKLTSLCRYWPMRPFTPKEGEQDYKDMKADPDWWKPARDLGPGEKKSLSKESCK